MSGTTHQPSVQSAVSNSPSVGAAIAQAAADSHGNSVKNLLPTEQQAQAAPGRCVWHLGAFVGMKPDERGALAWLIADAVMRRRGGTSRAADLWRNAALIGTKVTGTDRDIVAAFIEGVFGLPPQGRSEDHLIGHVAEWLWYLHAVETVDPIRSIALLDSPKFNVTEPGADGFIIFSDNETGVTSFRLWEVKQHTGTSALSSTVSNAYDQLNTNALRYLAQLTSIHSMQAGPLGELCSQLVDFWADCNDRAGVGVGVASATIPAPKRCFSTMGNRFPGLTTAGQLEGLLLAVEDLPGLARDVRGYLWTVL